MRRACAVLGIAFLAAGCVSSGPVRELGGKEREAIDAARDRLRDNRPKIEDAAFTLAELGAEYAEKEFGLDLALAKAKQIDSMQSLLAVPSDELVETRRAVLLYHLYEVERTQQRVLDARIRERYATVREITSAYRRLETLLGTAAENLEIVLKYLNQPKSARILAATETFLSEVEEFREAMAKTESPQLRRLAADVERYEAAAAKAQEEAMTALRALGELKGD